LVIARQPDDLKAVPNRSQRVSQLVSKGGEEIILPAVGVLEALEQPEPNVRKRHVVAERFEKGKVVLVEAVPRSARERQRSDELILRRQGVAGVSTDAESLDELDSRIVRVLDV